MNVSNKCAEKEHQGLGTAKSGSELSLIDAIKALNMDIRIAFDNYHNHLGAKKVGTRRKTKANDHVVANENFKDFSKMVLDEMNTGMSAEELESEAFFHFASRDNKTRLFTPIRLSMAFCIESFSAFKYGREEKAWAHLENAKKYVETAKGSLEMDAAKLQERAKLGGHAKAASQYGPFKDEVKKLLESKRPASGWGNITEAINGISKDLEKNLFDNPDIKLKSEELPNLLRRWINSDAEIKAAYSATTADTAKNEESL